MNLQIVYPHYLHMSMYFSSYMLTSNHCAKSFSGVWDGRMFWCVSGRFGASDVLLTRGMPTGVNRQLYFSYDKVMLSGCSPMPSMTCVINEV